MADINKIKEILKRDLKWEARGKVTDQQLAEIARRIAERETINESTMRKFASEVVHDENVFICAAVDVGDIENELKKPRK
jgi:hypothetical protein